jgi:hypothetical protein
VTGYLDRLVARASGQSPSGLTPRRRSRYEDAAAGGDGFQVVEGERAAPRSLAPESTPAASMPAAEVHDEVASPSEAPRRAADDARVEAAPRSDRPPDDLRHDQGAVIEVAAARGEQGAVVTPIAVTASAEPAPTPPARVAPDSAPASAPRAAGTVTTSAVAAATTTTARRDDVPAASATTRLSSTSGEAAPDDRDADEAPTAWPITSSARAGRGARRQPATAPATEPVVVEVTIGRVEIRAVPEPAPAAAPTSSAPPLSDYLRDRARATGGRR